MVNLFKVWFPDWSFEFWEWSQKLWLEFKYFRYFHSFVCIGELKLANRYFSGQIRSGIQLSCGRNGTTLENKTEYSFSLKLPAKNHDSQSVPLVYGTLRNLMINPFESPKLPNIYKEELLKETHEDWGTS